MPQPARALETVRWARGAVPGARVFRDSVCATRQPGLRADWPFQELEGERVRGDRCVGALFQVLRMFGDQTETASNSMRLH